MRPRVEIMDGFGQSPGYLGVFGKVSLHYATLHYNVISDQIELLTC